MIFPPLYLIADPSSYLSLASNRSTAENMFFESIGVAIDSGVLWIQYRDKHVTRRTRYENAKKLSDMVRDRTTSLIINDDIDLVMAVQADGVHLGQDDFPVAMARTLLGPSALIGLSTHTLDQVRQAQSQSVDYIGFGPIFETKTKSNADTPVGISGIAAIRKHVSLPIYAIGGIKIAALEEIIGAGASGVAVGAALANAKKDEILDWQSRLDRAVLARDSR